MKWTQEIAGVLDDKIHRKRLDSQLKIEATGILITKIIFGNLGQKFGFL